MKQIECKYCYKVIDFDSNFCKYCGKDISDKGFGLEDERMKIIFWSIHDTLRLNSGYTEEEFEKTFEPFKKYENRILCDNDYYIIIVNIIFYSGFRASTVEKYIKRIHEIFNDYNLVCNHSFNDIEIIKADPTIIKNTKKIEACIENAKNLKTIVNKYGSMENYISSFNPNKNDENLFKLKNSLIKNFSYIGEVTSYHFMTDIGLNVLKPDRVILRIFYRLGLIENDNDLFGAIKVGRFFSKVTNLPIRYIDIIFVLFGQLNQERIMCICSEKNPKCNICGSKQYCNYFNHLKEV